MTDDMNDSVDGIILQMITGTTNSLHEALQSGNYKGSFALSDCDSDADIVNKCVLSKLNLPFANSDGKTSDILRLV